MARALDAPPAGFRLLFLYGPDEGGAATLVKRMDRAMGDGAERIDMDGPALKQDPARLSDEAAAFSMFGDRRWIRLTGVGEESLPALEALLDGAPPENPVVAVAGDLRKTSKLLKYLTDHPAALVHACYLPDQREAAMFATDMARERGLGLPPDLARRLAELNGNDRALIGNEVEKLALYLDAAPDRPADLTAEALDALSAENAEGDVGPLVNAVMGGRVHNLLHELAMMEMRGAALASVMRPLIGRAMVLSAILGEMERGARLDEAYARKGKGIFWKDEDHVKRQVRRWSAATIARAIERLTEAERLTRNVRSVGEAGVRQILLSIAMQAAREG